MWSSLESGMVAGINDAKSDWPVTPFGQRFPAASRVPGSGSRLPTGRAGLALSEAAFFFYSWRLLVLQHRICLHRTG